MAPIDKLLLGLFLPTWLTSFLLSLAVIAGDSGFAPIFLQDAVERGGHPTMEGVLPWVEPVPENASRGERLLLGFQPWTANGAPDLARGDEIRAVGQRRLEGASALDFALVVIEASWEADRGEVTLLRARGGDLDEVRLPLVPFRLLWPFVPVSLAFGLVAILLVIRGSGSRLARRAFVTFAAFALATSAFFVGPVWRTGLVISVFLVTWSLLAPAGLWLIGFVPESVPARSRWAPWLPWPFLLLGPASASQIYGADLYPEAGIGLVVACALLIPVAGSALVADRYRRAGARDRRQLKWFFAGILLALAPLFTASVFLLGDAAWVRPLRISVVGIAAIPICFALAVSRSELLDVDRLISTTLTYNVVAVVVVATALALLPFLADSMAAWVGVDSTTSQAALSLLLATLFVPGHRQLRPRVERVLFRERHRLDRGIEDLLTDITRADTLQEMLAIAGEGLARLVQPECCSVYMRGERHYAPVFASGRISAPTLAPDTEVVGLVRKASRHVDVRTVLRGAQTLTPRGRGELDALSARLLIPIRQGERLLGFVGLGRKLSGDIYTPVDRALLSRVGHQIETGLTTLRFQEVITQSEAMREAFRRYVPGAVADEIVEGRSPAIGEQNVAVLFVDIRGYSSLSEGRASHEIFQMISTYTSAVTRIVQEQGGCVVEFNGDGMMAVFGAPRPIPAKERAAVDAALGILKGLRGVHLGASPVEVGIGIATGPGFVGNIEGADRHIWSVIGNTTNLAARLQDLTRTLGASIVVDSRTHAAAGGAAESFVHCPGVTIRGRERTEDVYTLVRSSTERPG